MLEQEQLAVKTHQQLYEKKFICNRYMECADQTANKKVAENSTALFFIHALCV